MYTTTPIESGAVNDNSTIAMKASGLRVMHTSRWIQLDQLIDLDESLTFGRTNQRDIRLYAKGVSRFHCKITRTGLDEFTLEDCDSKNGVWVSRYGAYTNFERIDSVVLEVGMHIQLGRIELVAVDAEGTTPIIARRYSEFVVQAYATYGSAMEASRRIGRRSQAVILRIVNCFKRGAAS